MKNAAFAKEKKGYSDYIKAVTPKTALIPSLFRSFWVGGLTCTIAQGFNELFSFLLPSTSPATIAGYSLSVIITIAIFLTGIGVFDKIGRYAGAGAFLPITGFANAMASASLEHKTEGLVLGSGAKFFSVVGPVLVSGVVFSTLVGLIYAIVFAARGG